MNDDRPGRSPFNRRKSSGYASSTTYVSGAAVVKAAEMAAERIKARAAKLINKQGQGEAVSADDILLEDAAAFSPDGRSVAMKEIALSTLHYDDQEQIMGIGSYYSPVSPPPFGAQFAEVTVDTETGQVTVDNLVMAVDAGIIVNPITASGQVEGGMTQALGYAVCEEIGRAH